MARGRSERKTGHRLASYLRHCGLAAAALFCIAGFAAPGSADDGPVKATLAATVNDGYARLIFDMSEFDDASVRLANNVLIITFARPIDVAVERLASQIPDYVGVARRDPDGKGIRVGLAQQVKVNATSAAEKFFIDLLPASWSGQPPSLPQEVIADLARRAREADRLERKERQAVAQQRATAEPVRVHVATQPTFTRYIFAIPANTSVSNDRVKERLTLTFDAPIKFDLADVVASLPRGDRRHRYRNARRQRIGAVQFPRQCRRPVLPRRWQLCARCRRRRQQAGRAGRGARAAGYIAAKRGARDHRARNSPARGGERRCRAPN